MLILAPSRELAAQLAADSSALLPPGSTVKLLCLGERLVATRASLEGAAVIVATPIELAEALAADAALFEWLPSAIGTLILDEVDVLMPR